MRRLYCPTTPDFRTPSQLGVRGCAPPVHCPRPRRPGHPLPGQPGRHRRSHPGPDRGSAGERDRLGDLLRELHARRRRPWAVPSSTWGGRAADRWLLYQSSIGSPVYDILATRPEPKLVNYHNITPAHLLAVGARRRLRGEPGADPARTAGPRLPVGRGRLDLQRARARRGRLRPTAVVPVLIDMTATGADPDPALAGRLAAAKAAAGPTSSSWARSLPTRPPTTW